MDWLEIKISLPAEKVEEAAAIANMVVPYGIYIEDYSDLEQGAWEIAHIDLIDEDLLQQDRSVAYIHVYFDPSENPAEAVAFLQERFSAVSIPCKVETNHVREQDWANNWKKYFKPLSVGEKLLICPSWETVENTEQRTILSIDPGMAFGTGGHDTTRMVLEAIEPLVTEKTTVLDVGCGSGVLSIAALLFGAKSALGVDIDELAVKMAIENGEKNGLSAPQYTILQGDLVQKVSGTYDLILANIVADAILMLSPAVPSFLKPNGTYIVSGILAERGDEVAKALSDCGFLICERRQSGGWVCLVCRKE